MSKKKSPPRRPGRQKRIRLEKGQRRRLRVGGPPRRVVTPRSALAGIGWPAVPPTMESAVLALNYQFEQSQWWPPGTIEALQLRQAEQLLAHAWRTVPFYRDRLAPLTGLKRGQLTMEAWRRIPILTRTDIQDAGHDLVSRALPRGHGTARDASTSGSTGQPVWFKRTRVTGLFFAALNLRYHLWHGRDFSAKSAKIGRLSDPNAVEEPHNWVPGHVSGPMVQLDFSKSVEEQLAWLQRFAPQYLLTFPSNLRALLQGSVETGINIPSLREVATMSEVLEPDLRVKCRRIWGLPVTDVYSAHEVGMIAIQCPEHPHYHVQAESVLVEVLNDHGEPCRPGESGRVVVTDLHNFSSPLIRYDINDIAIPGGPCSCGRGLAVIKSILGRIRNALTLPSGEKVWPAYHFIFDDALGKSLPSLREAQLVQRKLDEIEVRIVATRPVTAEEEARARKALGKAISDAFAFRFVYVDDLPRPPSGKLQVVLSELGD